MKLRGDGPPVNMEMTLSARLRGRQIGREQHAQPMIPRRVLYDRTKLDRGCTAAQSDQGAYRDITGVIAPPVLFFLRGGGYGQGDLDAQRRSQRPGVFQPDAAGQPVARQKLVVTRPTAHPIIADIAAILKDVEPAVPHVAHFVVNVERTVQAHLDAQEFVLQSVWRRVDGWFD